MNTLATVLIIVLAVFIIAAVIIVAVSILSNKKSQPSEIHFSGGADIDNGRLSSDKNYFKGLSGALGETVVVNESHRQAAGYGFYITIKNPANGQSGSVAIDRSLDFGRAAEVGVYEVRDKSVSWRHCRIELKNGKLFLSDLNSSNHTYLNGRQVYQSVEVHSGDTIKIGNTKLEIYF